MAARGGTRAKGTDGNDFSHREKVASHYQISSDNKRRLKTSIFFHLLLFVFIVLKLSTEILNYFKISLKNVYDIALPKPSLWEWIWLSSILFIIPACLALRRNNITPMKIYVGGTFVCGICPLISAIIYHSGDLKVFLTADNTDKIEKFYGIPIVLILCVFVVVTFLVHSLSLMFAINLIRAWTPKKGKKKM
uniref:BLTX780 n=2 Tax=Nephila pilipes TaxID=299642 RepID=A0A076L0E8_NEPPI|nr:BLTX780 [Nephila pilipes]